MAALSIFVQSPPPLRRPVADGRNHSGYCASRCIAVRFRTEPVIGWGDRTNGPANQRDLAAAARREDRYSTENPTIWPMARAVPLSGHKPGTLLVTLTRDWVRSARPASTATPSSSVVPKK